MNVEAEELSKSINSYKQQLIQVQHALDAATDQERIQELTDLQNNLRQVIELTEESLEAIKQPTCSEDAEFALFMDEMKKAGALQNEKSSSDLDVQSELKALEGTKCKAPFKDQRGAMKHHDAMICSIISPDNQQFEDIRVKVMFINPTCIDMLPCPYLLNGDCKFEDDRCKYSHGEIVPFSSIQEYVEPNFASICVDSQVLAKRDDKLWSRAVVKKVKDNGLFMVKFQSDRECIELELENLLPSDSTTEEQEAESSDDEPEMDESDIINMSLMNPVGQALGDWEKYTKGVGSKIMQKMGYITGTGLGRRCDGRVEPVTAVCLPPGKSLDHCMQLRECANGDKDLFSAERKLLKEQKKQEERNIKNYERAMKIDVFSFINKTLGGVDKAGPSRDDHRKEIKKESSRNLNVASLRVDENIKQIERDIGKIKESLRRQPNMLTSAYKGLSKTLREKEELLNASKKKALDISNELQNRSDKRKLTVF